MIANNKYFVADSYDKLLIDSCKSVMDNGVEINGTKELVGTKMVLTNPKNRYCINPFRKHNIYALIAESIWVITGHDDVKWLERFLPRASDFSDDGSTWRAGYGPRIRKWTNNVLPSNDGTPQTFDQLAFVHNELKKNRNTRQAVMVIWNPRLEIPAVGHTKDVPCFTGDTKIITNRGFVPIKDVKIGDLVLSYNRESENLEFESVLESGKTGVGQELIEITIDTGDSFKCTPNHILFVKEYSHIGKARQPYRIIEKRADELLENDILLKTPIYTDGCLQYKKNIRDNTNKSNLVKAHYELANIYNIEVSEGECIHHKDHHPLVNIKDNLEVMPISDHNSHHKLEDNPSKSEEVSRKRVMTNALSSGLYTNGKLFELWTRDDALNAIYECLKSGALYSLQYDYYQKYCGYLLLPSITQLSRSDWGFKDYAGVIESLNKKFHDIPDILYSRKVDRIKNGNSYIRCVGKVTKIKNIKEKADVYDIKVKNNSSFVLESGVVVHNCNNWINFQLRDNKLHMLVSIRSNDLVWGNMINMFEWATLQDLLASSLNCEVGELHLDQGSLHIYERHWDRANEIISFHNEYDPSISFKDFPNSNISIEKGIPLEKSLNILSKIYKLEMILRDPEDSLGWNEHFWMNWINTNFSEYPLFMSQFILPIIYKREGRLIELIKNNISKNEKDMNPDLLKNIKGM